jgi:hypothetical protein
MVVFNATLGEKRIELTKELIPTAGTIGYLLNPSNQMSEFESNGALAAARALGVELRTVRVCRIRRRSAHQDQPSERLRESPLEGGFCVRSMSAKQGRGSPFQGRGLVG